MAPHAAELSGIPPFESDARSTMSVLRSALADLVDLLPEDARRGKDLAKSLGIERTLAWKINKLVHETDPLAAVPYIPGGAGMDIVLRAAKKRGAPDSAIAAVRGAVERLDLLVDTHAGDRASLEMMASACSQTASAQVELTHRRAAFQANTFTWGVQAKTQFKTVFVNLAADPSMVDFASVRGFIDFRWIRSSVPWLMARSRVSDDADGVARGSYVRESLADSDNAHATAPLIRQFCSDPLPALRRVPRPNGFVDDELLAGSVGKTGATTCVIGDVCRCAGKRYRDERNRIAGYIQRVCTPCEVLVFDYVVHDTVYGPMAPELAVRSALGEEPSPATNPYELPRLPVTGSVQYIGKGAAALRLSDVPRYAELGQYVFTRLGWDGNRFDVYRVRLEYPPIPTLVTIEHALQPSPS